MKVLAINPGGTSTKVAVFDSSEELFNKNIQHPQDEVNSFATVFDQFAYRKDAIVRSLAEQNIALGELACVVGRGGLLKRVPGGTYAINDAMIDDLRNAINGEHPSNLGPVIAKSMADSLGIPSYIVDPVSVDEFWDIARVSGITDIERPSWLHALNHKAVCRETAARMGGAYADYNFIVAHLGSGISIAAHMRGKMVDGSGGRSNGPFSPERCGGLPAYPLVQLCFSGKYSRQELVEKISTRAGMFDYLGTKDMIEIEQRYFAGDKDAVTVMDAFIYQVAKDIAKYGASLCGKVDRVIITGGIAYSDLVVEKLAERIGYLAPVERIPGEREMEALASGALRVLTGSEPARTY